MTHRIAPGVRHLLWIARQFCGWAWTASPIIRRAQRRGAVTESRRVLLIPDRRRRDRDRSQIVRYGFTRRRYLRQALGQPDAG